MKSYLHEHITAPHYMAGMLSLPEVNNFLIITGLKNGFVPMSEWPVIGALGKKRYIDWVWLDPQPPLSDNNSIVAAFEIDAPDMPDKSVTKALDSLGAVNCDSKYQILYHIRKCKVLKEKKYVRQRALEYKKRGIKIVKDTELITTSWA